MNYRLILFFLSCFALSSYWCGIAPGADRPNVIFLLTDDQGYGDLSCHGNPVVKTPMLDKLHSESIRFTDYHVSPMCTPTRGELMTGLDAFQNGATFVCQGRSLPHRDFPTLANIFHDNGYATGHFGKWHLGDNYPYRPHDRGFEFSIHNKAWGIGSLSEYWKNNATDDRYWENSELKEFKGYNTDLFFNEAMQWIKKQDKPFFVYLPTTAAHSPYNVPERYRKPYVGQARVIERFFGMIANIDENMGRLDAFLKENDLYDNTIVIFMTDNGTAEGQRVYNSGMRGIKRADYDGGHRVPFFIRWPAANFGNPRDISTLTHSTDILPTLVELCDLNERVKLWRGGRSLATLLKDESGVAGKQFDDRMVVIQYRAKFEKWDGSVLWNKWRLVHGKELYDISTDPGQKTNVYEKYPEVVQKMRDHYEKWCKTTEKTMERTNFITVGTEHEPITWLSSCNWTDSYCDNWGNLASGVRLGHWSLLVEATGEYQVDLYLFHPDSKTPLNQGLRNVPARPVAKATLLVDGKATTLNTKPEDTHATFTIHLEKGQKLMLEGQFLNEESQPVFGAAYTFIKKVE